MHNICHSGLFISKAINSSCRFQAASLFAVSNSFLSRPSTNRTSSTSSKATTSKSTTPSNTTSTHSHHGNPRDHPFPYASMYAQAYALYKSGFQYWFDRDEIIKLNKHNRAFEAPNLERELVALYFRVPLLHEPGIFMTIARAMQVMGSSMTLKLNPIRVGQAFADCGFEKHRNKTGRGYIVMMRTAEEIRSYQMSEAMHRDNGLQR